MTIDLALVPDDRRDGVRRTLDSVFADHDVDAVEPGPTGASGAIILRVSTDAGPYLLRLEGQRMPGRNEHQYRNLLAAADASIAPPVLHVDETDGVLVTRWIDTQPLDRFPGGPTGLLDAIAALVTRVQELDPFPAHDDWAEVIGRMLDFATTIGSIAPDVAGRIGAHRRRIFDAWPRDPRDFVPAHNDPNAANLLFDGERLWLVDWETSAPNDPLVDLAVVANQLAPGDDLRDHLLTAWHGGPVDDGLRARLTLAQLGASLFAGSAITLALAPLGADPIVDLDAPSPAELAARAQRGELEFGTPATMRTFAASVLAEFCRQAEQPGFDEVLSRASD